MVLMILTRKVIIFVTIDSFRAETTNIVGMLMAQWKMTAHTQPVQILVVPLPQLHFQGKSLLLHVTLIQ